MYNEEKGHLPECENQPEDKPCICQDVLDKKEAEKEDLSYDDEEQE